MPRGKDSLRMGLGADFTPLIGISLAREKVAQLGAQCERVESSKSLFNSAEFLKTHLPLSISQGSLRGLRDPLWGLCPLDLSEFRATGS